MVARWFSRSLYERDVELIYCVFGTMPSVYLPFPCNDSIYAAAWALPSDRIRPVSQL